MTTVLRPDEQPTDNNATLTLQSDSTELYGRAAAGTNRTGDSSFGPPATDPDAPPGAIPGPESYRPSIGGNALSAAPPHFQAPNHSGAGPDVGPGTVGESLGTDVPKGVTP